MLEVLDDFAQPPNCWSRLFSGELCQISIPVPDKNFVWLNPSIIKHSDNNYLCAVRLMSAPWRPNTMSMLAVAIVDEYGIPKKVTQLKPPENDRVLIPEAPIIHIGAHDCRIFRVDDQLFGSATFWDNTAECIVDDEVTLGRIGLIHISNDLKWTKTTMLPSLFGDPEKNWMPVEGEFSWLYIPERNIFCSYDLSANKFQFKTIGKTSAEMENARGSTHLISVPDDKLLGVVHYVAAGLEDKFNFAQKLQYAHRFVLYDKRTKNLTGVSPYFYFISGGGIEFAAGLTLAHDGETLIVSFGYRDSSAWLASAKLDAVLSTMRLIS